MDPHTQTWNDGTISVMTSHHEFEDSHGWLYHIYYAGFNLTENMAGDDAAYIRVTVDGEHYDNLGAMNVWPYARFDYVLTNDQGYRKWLAGGGKTQGWTHVRVEITNVEKHSNLGILEFTVYEEDKKYVYTFKKTWMG